MYMPLKLGLKLFIVNDNSHKMGGTLVRNASLSLKRLKIKLKVRTNKVTQGPGLRSIAKFFFPFNLFRVMILTLQNQEV